MIRLLSFFILLAASSIVLAQSLYKWVEPDGSITFSVTPPETGINYETISEPRPESSLTAAIPRADQAEKAPALQQVLPDVAPSTSAAQPLAPQQSVQTLSRSPIQDEQASQSNASATYSENKASGVMGVSTNTSPHKHQMTSEHSAAVTARTRKQRQCEDLRKRVVSLERRLKTRLTPEDMDNTVIHMARYQRSYDQHCVQ